MAARVLITTDYLRPGDKVDRLLREHGFEPIYSPSRGPRTPADRKALFDGAAGAILASEPVTADMIAGAASLKVIARSGVGYDSIVDNVLITSHLARQTIEARERAGIEAAQAVIDVLEGREPTHAVA